jgi:hypothetical protein
MKRSSAGGQFTTRSTTSGTVCPLRVHSDSSAAGDRCAGGESGRLKHLESLTLRRAEDWTLGGRRSGPTRTTADLFTKLFNALRGTRSLTKMIGLRREDDDAVAAEQQKLWPERGRQAHDCRV